MKWWHRPILAAIRGDLRCMEWASNAYARLWDRTGAYIGTVRFTLLMGSIVPYGLYTIVTAPASWPMAIVMGGVFTVTASLLPFLFGLKAHLREERDFQRAANYDRLNRQAAIWALGRSLVMRVYTIGIFFTVRPLLALLGGDQSWIWDPSIYVCVAFWWAYGVSLGILVPPRKRRAPEPKAASNLGLEPLPA